MVALSADGATIAVGASDYTQTGGGDTPVSGRVRVFERAGGTQTWAQKGSFGNVARGYAIALSANGATVAIGAPAAYGNVGNVKIFSWAANSSRPSWVQKGSDIDGEGLATNFGFAIALSVDGATIAVGAPAANNGAGRGQMFRWAAGSETWLRKGSAIDGEAQNGNLGSAIALSADGTTVAIGAPNANGNAGRVQIFGWVAGSETWIQRGSTIGGGPLGGGFGGAISLSADGGTFAAGAYNSGLSRHGHVRVFSFAAEYQAWDQKGSDIAGEASNGRFGTAVSLSADGATVAVGAPSLGTTSSPGHALIFDWTTDTDMWAQRGGDISGETAGALSGVAVSLSADGSTVAIGAPHGVGSTEAGHARVFGRVARTVDRTPGDRSVSCVAQCVTIDHLGSVVRDLGNPRAIFICDDGVWRGQLACRDLTVQATAWAHRVVDLLDGVYYRPMPEMLGFGGAVQAAERDRYGSLAGHMATPFTAEQNEVLVAILDRLQTLPTPPPTSDGLCNGDDGARYRSCYDYGNAWLPIVNMEQNVANVHRLDYEDFLAHDAGAYFHAEVPMWTWTSGDRAGQVMWNGTCELCCPCCGNDASSNDAYDCADIPGSGGLAGNSTYANWVSSPTGQPNNATIGSNPVNHPVPDRTCVDITTSGAWRTTSCNLGPNFKPHTLHHVIVQFSGDQREQGPIDLFPACGAGAICECDQSADTMVRLPLLEAANAGLPNLQVLQEIEFVRLLNPLRIDCLRSNLTAVPTFRRREPVLRVDLLLLASTDARLSILLQHNQIAHIPAGHFDHIDALGVLDLSDNVLTMAPRISNPELQKLFLDRNPFSNLEPGIFGGLPALETLRLNGLSNVQVILAGVFFQPANPELNSVNMLDSGVVTVSPFAFSRTFTYAAVPCVVDSTTAGPPRCPARNMTFQASSASSSGAGVDCTMAVVLDDPFRSSMFFSERTTSSSDWRLVPICSCPANLTNHGWPDAGCIDRAAIQGCSDTLRGDQVQCDVVDPQNLHEIMLEIGNGPTSVASVVAAMGPQDSVICRRCPASPTDTGRCATILRDRGLYTRMSVPYSTENRSGHHRFAPCPFEFGQQPRTPTTGPAASPTPASSETDDSSAGNTPSPSMSGGVVAGLSVALAVVVLAGAVLAARLHRRRSRDQKQRSMFDKLLDMARTATSREFASKYRRIVELEGPARLAELEIALAKLRVNGADIELRNKVGDGTFGPIHLGLIRGRPVLAKTVTRPVRALMTQCLVEARLTLVLAHPNIVSLVAVVDSALPVMYAVEHVAGGTLKQYLKRHRPGSGACVLGEPELVGIAAQIAAAGEFLELKNVVHRSLAADFVVISGDGKTVKLSNVGEARDIYQTTVYVPAKGAGLDRLQQLAVRHMAPETITDDVYSTKSDVWSFGITCWEILTFGKMPYGALSATEIADEIRGGRRLELPRTCSEPLGLLVASTWETNPKARPSFSKLLESLKLHSAVDSAALLQLRSRSTWLSRRSDETVPARHLELGRSLPSSGGFSRRLADWTSPGAADADASGAAVQNLAVVLASNGSYVTGAMSDLSIMKRIPQSDELLGIVGQSRLQELGPVTVLHCADLSGDLLHEAQLPDAAKWQACVDVAKALEHLHANSVVLRTLTPASCHVTRGWRVKVSVTDTVLTKPPADDASGGGSGQAEATMRPLTPWTAPETAVTGELTSASNVHSCGTLFWCVFSKAAPWSFTAGDADFGDKIGTLPPLDGAVLPPALRPMVKACHRPGPPDRPSMSSLVTELLEGPDGTGWEITRGRLEAVRTLGAGNFGDVTLMLLRPDAPGEHARRFVAVKSLRDQANALASQEFLAELEVMKSLRHPHLVQLHGAVTSTAPQLIVLEYLAGGALDEWLQANGAHLKPEQPPRILHQIALGMSALAGQAITHRDLAARNVLVGEHDNVKVGDFGLSRVLDEKAYYTMKTNGMIALRWTAPECFTSAQWTSLSDVYSFGIVVSEVYTCGATPFEAIEDSDLIAMINGTEALDRHLSFSSPLFDRPEAPLRVHALASWCLRRPPESRPSFEALADGFLHLCSSVALLPSPDDYLDIIRSDEVRC